MARKRFVTLSALTPAVLSALLMLVATRSGQAQTETVLYNFQGSNCQGPPDGQNPVSRLTFDSAGNLYGTTFFGGLYGFGAVYELSQNGAPSCGDTVLYSFTGGLDGGCLNNSGPICLSYVIFDSAGNLYGTTVSGGAYNGGVVFELSPHGGPTGVIWTETVLHSFGGPGDGIYPTNGLILDRTGNLYGVTHAEFYQRQTPGTVYELSPSGGTWTESIIYTLPNDYDTYAGLTMDGAGNIFGSTFQLVFKLSTNGKGGWSSTVVHTFTGSPKDGAGPDDAPVLDSAGNLYGTTESGGAKNLGTVYKLVPRKNGQWTERILYSFKGGTRDGSGPFGGVVLDAAGNIYGTTTSGGVKCGCGTIFELVAPVGKGSYKEKVLWSFQSLNGKDGANPYSSLIWDGTGKLYGTTLSGGSVCDGDGNGCGVVFKVTP